MSGFSPPPADSTESHYCPDCGYDLRSISSPRCPECGLAIDLAAVSPIPWCHRHRIGRRRAFFRTVWLATFRPGKIAAAVAGPVDEKGANRFRWCVIAIAAIPLIAAAIAGLISLGRTGSLNVGMYPLSILNGPRSALDVPLWEASLMLFKGITLWPVTCIGSVLTLAILTRSTSIWFRDSSLSSLQVARARAIAKYACAPLVFLFLPTAMSLGIVLSDDPPLAVYILCGIFIFAQLFLCWLTTLRLLVRSTRCSIGRTVAAGISLPVMWAAAVGIGLGLFPALFGLLRMMTDSLRW